MLAKLVFVFVTFCCRLLFVVESVRTDTRSIPCLPHSIHHLTVSCLLHRSHNHIHHICPITGNPWVPISDPWHRWCRPRWCVPLVRSAPSLCVSVCVRAFPLTD